MRSLLYNQLPLRSYLNMRSMLAQTTLVVAWVCATFMLPFFSILVEFKKIRLVSAQIALSTFIFFLGLLFSCQVLGRLVELPHLVILVSLGFIASGCWLMGKQDEASAQKY